MSVSVSWDMRVRRDGTIEPAEGPSSSTKGFFKTDDEGLADSNWFSMQPRAFLNIQV